MSFRKFGGLKFSSKHNAVGSYYNTTDNLLVTQVVGQPNSYINFESDISGNISVYGKFDLSGNLYVSGDTSLHDTTIDGDLDLSGNLYVSGDTSLHDTTIDGDLTVTGSTYSKYMYLTAEDYNIDPNGVVPKSYVDSVATGLTPLPLCVLCENENLIDLSITAYGVTIDSVILNTSYDGSAVLINAQDGTNPSIKNGIYIISDETGTWTRAPYLDTGDIATGTLTSITGGTYAGYKFVCAEGTKDNPVYIETDQVVWIQFDIPLALGQGLEKNGNTIQVKYDLDFLTDVTISDKLTLLNSGTLTLPSSSISDSALSSNIPKKDTTNTYTSLQTLNSGLTVTGTITLPSSSISDSALSSNVCLLNATQTLTNKKLTDTNQIKFSIVSADDRRQITLYENSTTDHADNYFIGISPYAIHYNIQNVTTPQTSSHRFTIGSETTYTDYLTINSNGTTISNGNLIFPNVSSRKIEYVGVDSNIYTEVQNEGATLRHVVPINTNHSFMCGTTDEVIIDATDTKFYNNIKLATHDSCIQFYDNTQQTSAFTGAGAFVGSYKNSNITLDTNGQITAIANGSSGETPTLEEVLNVNNSSGSKSIKMGNNLLYFYNNENCYIQNYNGCLNIVNYNTDNGGGIYFYYNSVGSFALLNTSGQFTTASFNATSDYRIKENIEPLNETINVDNLKPVKYFNKQTKREDMGLVAHELQEVFPFLVNGEKDGEDYQSVNYNGLIPVLIKEIQDLKQEIKSLKNLFIKKID